MNIERFHKIDAFKLNQEFYFQSLLEEAYHQQLLSEQDIEKIQLDCLDLLSYKLKRYTDNNSSSVRIEVAEHIMQSNLFTIGLYLKTFKSPDDAIKAMTETSMLDLYLSGRKCIDAMLRTAKRKHSLVIKNTLEIDNDFYIPTVIDGIKGFFKIYNPDYAAHEIYITADYPLCHPVKDLAGIEFIQRYVDSVYAENLFCSHFSTEAIRELLLGFDEQYKHLLFNIFGLVLTEALGCVLAGMNAESLYLSPVQIQQLQKLLSIKTDEEIKELVSGAKQKMISELEISNNFLLQYIEECLPGITAAICSGIRNNRLDPVFLSGKVFEPKKKLQFSAGVKMSDQQYREMVEEIIQCSTISDKVSIIKNSIHSLDELESIFSDAELNNDELTAVFKTLQVSELAALLKRHPNDSIDSDEAEQNFRECLHNYIVSLPKKVQNNIISTADLFAEEDSD